MGDQGNGLLNCKTNWIVGVLINSIFAEEFFPDAWNRYIFVFSILSGNIGTKIELFIFSCDAK